MLFWNCESVLHGGIKKRKFREKTKYVIGFKWLLQTVWNRVIIFAINFP